METFGKNTNMWRWMAIIAMIYIVKVVNIGIFMVMINFELRV